jgi:hypothetical protein
MAMTRRRFLQVAAVGTGLGTVGAGLRLPTALASHPGLVQPSYGDLGGYNILSYSNLAFDNGVDWGPNWDKTAEFRVSPRGEFAYTSNYQGFSILDVSNPNRPRVISRVRNSPTVQSQYLDVSGDLLIVNQEGLTNQPNAWQGGIRLFDVSDPEDPSEVGFFQSDQTRPEGEGETFRELGGRGVHGFWIHEDPNGQGRFCFVCTSSPGYYGNIVVIVDINDPANPREVGRWWYPGQGPGEEQLRVPNQTDTNQPLPKMWVFAHDLTTFHDRCYIGYRDVGVQILDISDLSRPTQVGEIAWTGLPHNQANTHSVGVVVPKRGGRAQTIVATDEIGTCPYGWLHIIDISDEANPSQISELKLPLNEVDNCSPPDRPGRRFSIHDVDRLIRGDIIHSAWEEAGFWAIDISNPALPRAVTHYVPPVRSDSPPTSRSGHADDVFVLDNGLVFGSSSDTGAGGLWIMRRAPGVKGTVSWNATETGVIVKRRGS